MTGLTKAALVLAAALAAIMIAPILIAASLLPTHTSRSFYDACAELRGTRARILPDPPTTAPSATEVLLRIDQTASTLGFGRQGATVAAAISVRMTGLANAANPAVPDTERYAHSAVIQSGAGALGLPETWGTAAELMTPATSTALLMDHMVTQFPNWRDLDPPTIAAGLLGGSPEDYTAAAAHAQRLLSALPPQPHTPAEEFTPTPATSRPPPAGLASRARKPLDPEQIRDTARDNPEATSCVQALSVATPPPAPGPNPRGPALAAAARAAAGREQDQPSATGFVVEIFAAQGVQLPDSVAELFTTGWSAPAADPGDLVFTDISAADGPHLVGIAVDSHTMVTVLPGRSAAEAVPIGPNRILRRTEVNTA
jgi:hypothetical protein